MEDILPAVPETDLLEAIKSLGWRNLIERQQQCFTQQPIVVEYVIERFIKIITNEISEQKIDVLNQYILIKTSAKEYTN